MSTQSKGFNLHNLQTIGEELSELTIKTGIEDRFKEIASYLMNDVELQVNDTTYRLIELEFYYFHSANHSDPFVHNHANQLIGGKWYFHGSGLDITIGSDSIGAHGGILIRGIKKKNTGHFTSGPIRVITEIFSSFSIDRLDNFFGLKPCTKSQDEPIMCPRIGLNSINKKDGDKFLDQPYRFIVEPGLKHGFKDKTKVAQYAFDTGQLLKEEVNKLFGGNYIK